MSLSNYKLLSLATSELTNIVTPCDMPLAGTPGYGVGVYSGSDAYLKYKLDLTPMDGCDDPESDNFGNYIKGDGGIYVFVPKFYYRFLYDVDETDTETLEEIAYYSEYTVEQLLKIKEYSPLNGFVIADGLQFKDEAEANEHDFILHRAFIDGGIEQAGFFIGKYEAATDTYCSIQGAIPAASGTSLSSDSIITLCKTQGDNYTLSSAFMYSAIGMLSKFLSTVVDSDEYCAWYSDTVSANHPKGNTNSGTDAVDSSVTFTLTDGSFALCGSGDPFNKTTHNGQNCGIADINGNRREFCNGIAVWHQSSNGYRSSYLAESARLVDLATTRYYSTVSNISMSLYDGIHGEYFYAYDYLSARYASGAYFYWGSSNGPSYFTDKEGAPRALCGIFPANYNTSAGTDEFGAVDHYQVRIGSSTSNTVLLYGGNYNSTFAFHKLTTTYQAYAVSSDANKGWRVCAYAD